MGKTFLIDTNTILEYTSGLLPDEISYSFEQLLDRGGFYISVINKIEVLGHPSATEDLNYFLETAVVHHLTDDVINQTIDLRKERKMKLPDAIIAATAIVHGHDIITRNIRDFKNIANLNVVDPYQL